MKSLLFISLVIINSTCTTTTVYICDSKNAIRYHYKENCRGLSNCHYRIIETTLDSAKMQNKTLCEWERKSLDHQLSAP
ncbi:MAG: hypothetical protein QM731_02990 [Chitinophagaceae bacterium]